MFNSINILIFIGVLLILVIIFLVIKILPKTKSTTASSPNIDILLTEIKNFMSSEHPNIILDYDEIIEKINSKNSVGADFCIAEEVAAKFISYDAPLPTNRLPQEQHWSTYEEMSAPIHNRLPKDFHKRKVALYMNSDGACQRCGLKLKIEEMNIYFLKSLEKHGTYRLENLVALCPDCYKVMTTSEYTPKFFESLKLYDNILDLIE